MLRLMTQLTLLVIENIFSRSFSNLSSYKILITFHFMIKALNDEENALALIPFQTAFNFISTFAARMHFKMKWENQERN